MSTLKRRSDKSRLYILHVLAEWVVLTKVKIKRINKKFTPYLWKKSKAGKRRRSNKTRVTGHQKLKNDYADISRMAKALKEPPVKLPPFFTSSRHFQPNLPGNQKLEFMQDTKSGTREREDM